MGVLLKLHLLGSRLRALVGVETEGVLIKLHLLWSRFRALVGVETVGVLIKLHLLWSRLRALVGVDRGSINKATLTLVQASGPGWGRLWEYY